MLPKGGIKLTRSSLFQIGYKSDNARLQARVSKCHVYVTVQQALTAKQSEVFALSVCPSVHQTVLASSCAIKALPSAMLHRHLVFEAVSNAPEACVFGRLPSRALDGRMESLVTRRSLRLCHSSALKLESGQSSTPCVHRIWLDPQDKRKTRKKF